jgi:serine/threonine protein kinase
MAESQLLVSDSQCGLREFQRRAWRDGKRLSVEALVAGAGNALVNGEILELIYAEVALRTEFGDKCKLDEYLQRFPDLAESLRTGWQIHICNEDRDQSDLFLDSSSRDASMDEPIGMRLSTRTADGTPSQSTSSQIRPETVILDRYRMIRLVGRGGMGAVYEAVDERLGNRVALKQKLGKGYQAEIAFEREAKLLAHLQHPGLPRVIDYFNDGSRQFLVMDFVAGDNLAELIPKRKFDVSLVVGWATELLGVLQYFLDQNPAIVHRDIKPQNIKLRPSGEIVLLDFGLAKGGVAWAENNNVLSSTGCTPTYASLEQLTRSGTDWRSDVYSLGATLYHLLTGRPPIDAVTRAAQILNGRPDPLIPIASCRSDVPIWLSDLLLSMMSIKIDERAVDISTLVSNLNNPPTANTVHRLPSGGCLQFLHDDKPVSVPSALGRAQKLVRKLAGTKILWVDDRPRGNKPLCGILGSFGIQVDQVTTTAEALYRIGSDQSYDLIISDIARDGVEDEGILFLRELEGRGNHPAVIFFIAMLDLSRGMPVGAFGITNSGTELLQLVCDAIERKRN